MAVSLSLPSPFQYKAMRVLLRLRRLHSPIAKARRLFRSGSELPSTKPITGHSRRFATCSPQADTLCCKGHPHPVLPLGRSELCTSTSKCHPCYLVDASVLS